MSAKVLVNSCLALLVGAVAGFAAHGDTVMLKTDAFVPGPKIFLGDIAEVQGEHRDLLLKMEVGLAPRPGVSKRINASLIESRISRLGLKRDDVELKGPGSMTVTTLHLDITQEMVEEELRVFIEKQMPWSPADAIVDVAVPSRTMVVPDGTVSIRWRPNPPYRFVGSGTVRGDLLVDGKVRHTFQCKTDVDAYVDVLVADERIDRGAAIGKENLRTEKRAFSSLKSNRVVSLTGLAGHVARSTILPGELITERSIMPQRLVERNQIVRVEIISGTLRVRGRARALANGAAGDTILCENPTSKERFEGIVRKDGVIIIP